MDRADKHLISRWIKSKSKEYGFMSCGISAAAFLESEAHHLEHFLNQGRNGKMGYLENHFDKRLDPRLLVDDAKSVISFLLNYYPKNFQREDSYKVSKYAYGEDYHFVIKDKLRGLMAELFEEIGEFNGRAFVDSAPVLDKAWAAKSGLGWIGKNANLISKKAGSFFFVAEIILDVELEYDNPTAEHCGQCTACIDACPTNAIVAPYEIDGSRCISYLTIELKEEIPSEFNHSMDQWMFGCDVCQDVCPWNRFSQPNSENRFNANENWHAWNKKDWEELTEEVFAKVFKNSPLKRKGFNGVKNTMRFLKNT